MSSLKYASISTNVEPKTVLKQEIEHKVDFIDGNTFIVKMNLNIDKTSIILELKRKIKYKYGYSSEKLQLIEVDSTEDQYQWYCQILDSLDFELEIGNTTTVILPYYGCQNIHKGSTITLVIPCAILNKFYILPRQYCYGRLKKYLIRIAAEKLLNLEGRNCCFVRQESTGELSVNVQVNGLTYQQNNINSQCEIDNIKCLIMIHELGSIDKYIKNTSWCL